MARRRLTNDDWSVESNCFVCEEKNDRGLQIPFFHEPDREVVVAEFELGRVFSGAPKFVHGGVTLAILDEAQAWAAIAIAGKFAVTSKTTAEFQAPVVVDRAYVVEARVDDQREDRITTSAEVRNEAGDVCAAATATFLVLSEAQARRAVGAPDVDIEAHRDLLGG